MESPARSCFSRTAAITLLLIGSVGTAANGQVTISSASRQGSYSTDGGSNSFNDASTNSIHNGANSYAGVLAGEHFTDSAGYDQTSSITVDSSGNLSVFATGGDSYNMNGPYFNTSPSAHANTALTLTFNVGTATSFSFNGTATGTEQATGAIWNGATYAPPSFGTGISGLTGSLSQTPSGPSPVFNPPFNFSQSNGVNGGNAQVASVGSGTIQPGTYTLSLKASVDLFAPYNYDPNHPSTLTAAGTNHFTMAFTTAPNTQQLTAAAPYTNFSSQTTSGFGTKAQLIDGTAGGNRTVEFDSFNGRGTGVASDIVNLSGTGSDTFVLQMQYDPATVQALGGINAFLHLQLGWINPATGTWVNSVLGNTDGGAGAHEIFGAYDPNSDFQLGYYGVDTASGTVWAVLNHNSAFAVIDAVPEPYTWALLLGGAGLLVVGQQFRRSRAA